MLQHSHEQDLKDLSAQQVEELTTQYKGVIEGLGGTVEKVDIWGRRRLAYEIDKKAEGIYALLDVKCSSAAVAELDRQLSLNESVLRTKVMRLDSK